ncbi:hypothetical protein ACOJBO_14390 [Rhizobium beringeri]
MPAHALLERWLVLVEGERRQRTCGDRTAMRAFEQSAFSQKIEIAAYRHTGNAKLVGKARDRHEAVLFE